MFMKPSTLVVERCRCAASCAGTAPGWRPPPPPRPPALGMKMGGWVGCGCQKGLLWPGHISSSRSSARERLQGGAGGSRGKGALRPNGTHALPSCSGGAGRQGGARTTTAAPTHLDAGLLVEDQVDPAGWHPHQATRLPTDHLDEAWGGGEGGGRCGVDHEACAGLREWAARVCMPGSPC